MDDRQLLARLAAGPVSGDALARETGVTRAAIWKRVHALREAGLPVDAQAGEGYRLTQPLDLLDAGRIGAALPPPVRAAVTGLDVLWSVDSTNAELLRRGAPAQGVAAVLAERQTGGRGRRGRAWASPLAAHVYLSLARRFEGGLARLGGLSLVAGIAAAEALRAAGFDEVGLKWPNDLFAGGRKLGGLLIEGGGEHGGPVQAVIGIGVNVRMPEAVAAMIGQPWTDLSRLSAGPVSRDAVVAALLSHLLPALDLFDTEGLAPFLPRFAALDVLHGCEVQVSTGQGTESGIALGVAGDGALRVQAAGGERLFHAGEVSVRAAG